MVESKDIEPKQAKQVLEMKGALNAVEAQIRNKQLTGSAKRARRQEQARPMVQRLFAMIERQFAAQGFLPSSPSRCAGV